MIIDLRAILKNFQLPLSLLFIGLTLTTHKSTASASADLEKEAIMKGRLPIHPPSEISAMIPDFDYNIVFDGFEDEQLQYFVQTFPGVEQWESVLGEKGYIEAMDRLVDDSSSLKDGTVSLVGMVTKNGHYLIRIKNENMMQVKNPELMIALPGKSNGGDLFESDIPGSFNLLGLSNGVDSRERLTGNSIPEGLGAVQSSAGSCSGTLIGRRLVRTAAHCIIRHTNSGGAVSETVSFDYRRDGNVATATTTTSSFFYGGNYMPSNCARSTSRDNAWGYRNNFNACTWADWAILILDTNWHNGVNVSWFGYQGLTTSNLGMELQSGGYPTCGNAHSPSNCVAFGYYRDNTSACKVSAWTSATAKWRTGCDVSSGNSGGPVWREGTRSLVGHFQWEECTTCPSGTANRSAPNHYLGNDDWLFNYQNSLRSQYP